MNKESRRYLRQIATRLGICVRQAFRSRKLFLKQDGTERVPKWLKEIQDIRNEIIIEKLWER